MMLPNVGQKCKYRDSFGYWYEDGEVLSIDKENGKFTVSSQSWMGPPQYNDSITVFVPDDIGKTVLFVGG